MGKSRAQIRTYVALSQVWATAYREAAHRLGVGLLERPVHTQEEVREALAQLGAGQVDGILPPSALSLYPGHDRQAGASNHV